MGGPGTQNSCFFLFLLSAAGYLLIALFPFTTTSPADNRHYMQAYRHLYVLAMEKRKDLEAGGAAPPFQYDVKARVM